MAEIDHHLVRGDDLCPRPVHGLALSKLMSTKSISARESNGNCYEAVLRMTETLSTCLEPEELATTLADEIGKFLHFDHLYLLVLKENSAEIEYLVWGRGPMPMPDLPMEEVPSWAAIDSQDVLHTPDWDAEDRFPLFKEWAKRMGLGSGIRVPLTTPHRRLGVFGISSDTVNPFGADNIDFLRLIGRVVALAIDDVLNLRRAQHQNEQLQLLLNLTKRITSNLRLRDLLRAVAASVREVMHCDVVAVSLLEPESGKSRLYALDFPQGKGFISIRLASRC